MISLMQKKKKMQCQEHGLSIVGCSKVREKEKLLLVFCVTPLKLNQNQNRSLDKVQYRGIGICKDPRHDSGQCNFSYTRLSGEMFYPNS